MENPKIRFKGYTKDWEQRKLGDEAEEILAGGDIDKEKAVDDGVYPIYANALTNDGIVGYYDDYYRVKAPAVTVTGRGEVGRARARMIDFTPVVRLLAVRSNHDCYFLENAINNHKVVVESTGVPQLTVPQLSSYDICFPKDIVEEKKIGTYFNQLDRLITLHQRKCEQTKKLKKYMLQKMFPQNGEKVPEIRFDGFTYDWEQRKLGELGSLKNGMNFSKEAMGHGFPFINLQNIFGNNVIDVNKLELADATEKQLLEYSLLKGDVLFVRSSVKLEGVGEAALVPETLENTTYSGFIIRFRDEYGLNNDFKKYIFGTQKVRNQIMAQATNSANKNISQGVLENLTFEVPSFDEQAKIGEHFSNLDHLITLHQRKCDELKKMKKYMLQNMFI